MLLTCIEDNVEMDWKNIIFNVQTVGCHSSQINPDYVINQFHFPYFFASVPIAYQVPIFSSP